MAGFLDPGQKLNYVAVERLDKTQAGDKVDLPCFGMFEMSNGKIKVWRDYFDLNT
ncbi:MAG: limonene-1,2-epoxide hydrolase [Candidatus Azotimanducaceae bacterium]